jgi:hypothetical protein
MRNRKFSTGVNQNYTSGGGNFFGTAMTDRGRNIQVLTAVSLHRLWPAQNKSRLHCYVTGCSVASGMLRSCHPPMTHRKGHLDSRRIIQREWATMYDTTDSSQISGLCISSNVAYCERLALADISYIHQTLFLGLGYLFSMSILC